MPRPTPHARAMARCGSRASYFKRRRSRSFRIGSLEAAIRASFRWRKGPGSLSDRRAGSVARTRCSRSPESVFTMQESAFSIAGIRVQHGRNRCSASGGIRVQLRPEWAFRMGRSAHSRRVFDTPAMPRVRSRHAGIASLIGGQTERSKTFAAWLKRSTPPTASSMSKSRSVRPPRREVLCRGSDAGRQRTVSRW